MKPIKRPTAPADLARQERFCQEYAASHKPSEAAIAAGYGGQHIHPKSIAVTANRLLARQTVQARIAELEAEILDSIKITKEKVLMQYVKIAFRDVRQLYDDKNMLKNIEEFDENNAAAVVAVEVNEIWGGIGLVKKVKLADPKAALDSIAKMCGLNAPEKVDHTTKGEKIDPNFGLIDYSKLSNETLNELKKMILENGTAGKK